MGPVEQTGSGGRRGVMLAVIAGTVVIVAAIGLATWLITKSGHTPSSSTTGGGRQAASNRATGSPSTGQSSTPSTGQSDAPSAGLTVPASLAGTWTGTIKQTHNLFGDTLTSDVTIPLQAGKPTAEATYRAWGCNLTLTLTGRTDTMLTFTEQSNNAMCTSGDKITLTRQGGSLQYHAEGGPSGEVADGPLSRR